MASRRSFIAGLLATGLAPRPTWADAGGPAYISAGMTPNGRFVLCGLGANGSITFKQPLPSRGHAAAAHPSAPEAVAFARRPGTYAVILDCVAGKAKAQLTAPPGRHFYGHGAFSSDGALLFTTENDFQNARGVVGVWNARGGYKRLGEFASGGIGPHDIKLLADGTALVVANGGIETHPETGRTKLNIATMRPNLSYLSLDGSVLEQILLDDGLRKNSIRHLAVATDNTVAFAMQWQGDVTDYPPVLGIHRRGHPAQLSVSTEAANRRMAGYAGSVGIAGRSVAVTSPRGGAMQVFGIDDRRMKTEISIEDVCGVARSGDGFFVTNGLGDVVDTPDASMARAVRHNIQWDNHLVPV